MRAIVKDVMISDSVIKNGKSRWFISEMGKLISKPLDFKWIDKDVYILDNTPYNESIIGRNDIVRRAEWVKDWLIEDQFVTTQNSNGVVVPIKTELQSNSLTQFNNILGWK